MTKVKVWLARSHSFEVDHENVASKCGFDYGKK